MNNDFRDVVLNRRSIRTYDADHKIPKETMLKILEDAALAPSSVNSQPWRFVVVESQEGKDTLEPLIRFNKSQNSTSSAMILIFADMNCIDRAEEIYDLAVERGTMSKETRDVQINGIVPYYKNKNRQDLNDTVRLDAGLVAMQLRLVARSYGYDTCPIGGFERDQLARTFGLDEERYQPSIIISIGKAIDEGYDSVRLPVDTLTKWF